MPTPIAKVKWRLVREVITDWFNGKNNIYFEQTRVYYRLYALICSAMAEFTLVLRA